VRMRGTEVEERRSGSCEEEVVVSGGQRVAVEIDMRAL